MFSKVFMPHDTVSKDDSMAKVLLVDDDPINMLPLADFLSKSYSVSLMTGANEALDFLSRNDIDVILLDVDMPGMDGYEACLKVKNDLHLKNIPVIFITVKTSQDDTIKGFQCGASYYLEKPYNPEIVSAVVKTVIGESSLRNHLLEKIKKTVGSFGLLNEGCFSFQTLDEADNLSVLLASACPDPGRVVFGLRELFLNAIEHGNLGITYQEKSSLKEKDTWEEEIQLRLNYPENKNKFASVRFERNENEIVFFITDRGTGFDWRPYLHWDPQRAFHTHGRGIAMAKSLYFNDLKFRGSGNDVMAIVSLKKDEKNSQS